MTYNKEELKLEDLERYLLDLDKTSTASRERNFIIHTGQKGGKILDAALENVLFSEILKPTLNKIGPKVDAYMLNSEDFMGFNAADLFDSILNYLEDYEK